ncbi:MAG: hypothetical protein ACOCWO_06050 [Candidatus Muiribacteriaceae bacterium]
MRLLIYGFRPFLGYCENITEKIISRIPLRPDLHTHIFDVQFDKDMFLNKSREVSPDIIVGMGQCHKGKRLRVEMIARNVMHDRETAEKSLIDPTAPRTIKSDLKLYRKKGTRRSYDAGDYVCNFSMFTYLHKPGRDYRYVFLHIPRNFPVIQTAAQISRMCDQLIAGTVGRI